MHTRKPPSESVLLRAVEARALGKSWELVASLVRRSPHTVRKWPHTYPDRWECALRIADRIIIDSAGAESVLVLRELLRSEDDNIRIEAAWRLVYQRLEQSKLDYKAAEHRLPEPPSDAQRIAEFVKAHSHEQLLGLAANVLRTRLPRSLETPAVPSSGAA